MDIVNDNLRIRTLTEDDFQKLDNITFFKYF